MAAYARPVRPGRAARQRVLQASRAVGCTCKPDFELVRHFSDHVQHVQARHDDGCPALGAGRTVAIWPNATAS